MGVVLTALEQELALLRQVAPALAAAVSEARAQFDLTERVLTDSGAEIRVNVEVPRSVVGSVLLLLWRPHNGRFRILMLANGATTAVLWTEASVDWLVGLAPYLPKLVAAVTKAAEDVVSHEKEVS